MKKLFAVALAACLMAFTGCKSVPSAQTVETISYQVGLAAGLVVQLKVPEATTAKIVEIVEVAGQVVPSSNETFEVAWTPVVNKYVEAAVAEGKIDEGEATLIKYGMTMVEKALDYLFTRHPKWKDDKELVAAAIKGLSSGFIASVNPNKATRSGVEPDKDACQFLLLESKKLK